jgi:hypothetical protein
MTTTKRNLTIAIVAFAFMCVALVSCDHHTCPTYSKTTEQAADNKG